MRSANHPRPPNTRPGLSFGLTACAIVAVARLSHVVGLKAGGVIIRDLRCWHGGVRAASLSRSLLLTLHNGLTKLRLSGSDPEPQRACSRDSELRIPRAVVL